MAIVFSKRIGGIRYEVRTAGRSVRLYTDGVMHTQYHPGLQLTRGVWDLLALPALALPRVQRVLLLGVGGGAAIHLLRQWCPGVEIVGVELNPVHLQLARRYFGLRARDVELIAGDARDYVERYCGKPFDLVIEDLFGGTGFPDRSFAADYRWCSALGKLVQPQGALVINTLSPAQLRQTALFCDGRLRRKWPTALRLTLPAYANNVGVFSRSHISAADLRRAIRADPLRRQQERSGSLRYRIAEESYSA